MKKIIILLSALLLMVGMVSATTLGPELVNCFDFTCDTDWIGFGALSSDWLFVDVSDRVILQKPEPGPPLKADFGQDINIRTGTNYNVSIFVLQVSGAGVNLNVTLGGNTTIIFENQDFTTNEMFSVVITTINTDRLNVSGSVDGFGPTISLDSVSVKEINPPPPTIFIRHNNNEFQIPYTFFERYESDAWVIDLPKMLFRRLVRLFTG